MSCKLFGKTRHILMQVGFFQIYICVYGIFSVNHFGYGVINSCSKMQSGFFFFFFMEGRNQLRRRKSIKSNFLSLCSVPT